MVWQLKTIKIPSLNEFNLACHQHLRPLRLVFRTITNIDIKQGPYDRIMGIGSIEIQTAGFSAGKTGPEERLDGIPTQLIKELRNLILNKVRKVKGSPGTSHDLDHPEEDVLTAILNEIIKLKSILLERKN